MSSERSCSISHMTNATRNHIDAIASKGSTMSLARFERIATRVFHISFARNKKCVRERLYQKQEKKKMNPSLQQNHRRRWKINAVQSGVGEYLTKRFAIVYAMTIECQIGEDSGKHFRICARSIGCLFRLLIAF